MNRYRNVFGKFMGLLGLYRIDSFVITTFSFFVTLFIVHGPVFAWQGWILGLLEGAVFVNFIYSLNSYFDADIDAINKPFRPIPAGIVTRKMALRYIMLLGLASVLAPLLFIENKTLFIALYAFPVIGILYSNAYYPFKKKAMPATILTTSLLVLPAIDALLLSHSWAQYWYFAVILFFYCLCMVPLKDIEDVKGDVVFDSANWADLIGERKLLLYSLSGLAMLTVFVFIYRNVPGLFLLGGVFLCSTLVEIYFLLFKSSYAKLYKTLILSNMVLLLTGFAGFILKTLLGI